MNPSQADKLRIKLKFDNCFSIGRNGLSGGFVLLWNNDVEVVIKSYNSYHVDAVVKDRNSAP